MSAPALAPRLLRAAVFTAVCVVLSGVGHALAACAGIALWSLVAGFLGVFGVTVLFAGRERSLGFVAGALTAGQLGLHTLFGLGQRHLVQADQADDALVRLAARLVCGRNEAAMGSAEAARIVGDAGLGTGGGHAHATGTAVSGLPLNGTLSGLPVDGTLSGLPVDGTLSGLLPSLPMLLGHLLAALAAGWLLRRGDRAIVTLVRLSGQSATELAECALVRALRASLRLVRGLLAGLAAPHAGPRRLARTAFDSAPPPVAEALKDTVIRRGPPAADCVLAA